MRYENGETIRIMYEAKAFTTGLTDVVISIWGPAGTKLVDDASMTELANGLYYYDYTIPSTGNFLYQCSCASLVKYQNGNFLAVDSIWDAKINDHKSAGTMGNYQKHGGGLYQSKTTGMTTRDRESFIKRLDKILDKQKEFEKTVTGVQKKIDELDKILKTTNDNLDMKIKGIENNLSDKHDFLNSRNDEMGFKITSLIEEIENLKNKNNEIENITKILAEGKPILELGDRIESFKENMLKIDNNTSNIKNYVDDKINEFKNNVNEFQKVLIKTTPTDILNHIKFDEDINLDKKMILKELDLRKSLEEKEIEKLKEQIMFLKGKDYGMEIQKLEKQIIGLPFAQYKNFAECVKDQISKGYNEKQASAVCATIHKKTTGKWPSEMSDDYKADKQTNEQLIDDWRCATTLYKTKEELRPQIEVLGMKLFEEILVRIENKTMAFDITLDDNELLEKLQETSTTTPNIGKFGGRVFINPKKRKYKKMDEIKNWDKLVLEKTFGGDDVEIHLGENLLLAEKFEDKYHIYDVLDFEGNDVSSEPWYDRIKYLKKIKLKEDQFEAQTLIVSKDKLDEGINIMGNCKIRKYNGLPDDVVV